MHQKEHKEPWWLWVLFVAWIGFTLTLVLLHYPEFRHHDESCNGDLIQ